VLFQEKCSKSHTIFVNKLQENKSSPIKPSTSQQQQEIAKSNQKILQKPPGTSTSSKTFLDKWLQRKPEEDSTELNPLGESKESNCAENVKSGVAKYKIKKLTVDIVRLSDKIIDKFASKSKVTDNDTELPQREEGTKNNDQKSKATSCINILLKFRNIISTSSDKEKENPDPKPQPQCESQDATTSLDSVQTDSDTTIAGDQYALGTYSIIIILILATLHFCFKTPNLNRAVTKGTM
jgi:hypothetical protein